MSQRGYADEHDPLDIILREAELLVSQMQAKNEVGTQINVDSLNKTDASVDEMLQRAGLLLSQMDPGSDGSSLSFSQNTSWQPSLDTNLDDMLEKADLLANLMRAKSSEPEVLAAFRQENSPNANLREESTSNDDVDPLARAQLLASEIRSYQQFLDEANDNDEILSVDEMLHKAGILAVSMQHPPSSSVGENHSVSRNHIETPYLVRECDDLLANANWYDESPHEILASTPELIQKTDRLLAQIMYDGTTEVDSALSLNSHVDNMLRNTQNLLDQFQGMSSPLQHEGNDPKNDGVKSSSRPPRAPRPQGSPIKLLSPRHAALITSTYRNNIPLPDISVDAQESTARAAKAAEMAHLIQQTLNALADLDSESELAIALKDNAANMERAIVSLKNISASTKPDPPESYTPTSVSIQAIIDDELSSVGSGSARSLPLLMMSNSFNQGRPVNKQDINKLSSEKLRCIDVAVELSNQMEVDLEATFSQSSDQVDHKDECLTSRRLLKSELGDDSFNKLEQQRRWEKISSVTAEDEDFATMVDLLKKKAFDPIQFEKLSNANVGDEDYVPLLDFRKMGMKTTTGQRTNEFKPARSVGTFNDKARVRKTSTERERAMRLITIVLAFMILWLAWSWMKIPMEADHGDQVSVTDEISTETPGAFVVDRVIIPLLVTKENTETERISREAEFFTQTFNVKAEINEWDQDNFENTESDRRNEEDKNYKHVTIEEIAVHEIDPNNYIDESDENDDDEFSVSLEYDVEESNSIDDLESEYNHEINSEHSEYFSEYESSRYDEPEGTDRASGQSCSNPGGSDNHDKEQHVTIDIVSLHGFTSANETKDGLAVAERKVNSSPSNKVEKINFGHLHVPLGCLVPFSYLVSKNCRQIARTKPLVDIHSIVEAMLQ
jgi:hypothetical protein